MSNSLNTSQSPEGNDIPTFKKILILFPFLILPAYILLLFRLQPSGNTPSFLSPVAFGLNIVQLVFLFFSLLSLDMISIIYAIFLPMAWKSYEPKNPESSFLSFFVVIALSSSIVIFGYFIEYLTFQFQGIILWWRFVIFLLIGVSHTAFLYMVKLPPKYTFISRTINIKKTKENLQKKRLPFTILSLVVFLVMFIPMFVLIFQSL